MILSVMICSILRRAEQLSKLTVTLNGQLELYKLEEDVQILTCIDQGVKDGGMSIGDKRNRLMEAAEGDYVCFIDDDDTVSTNYTLRLVEACRQGPDCVGVCGEILWMGSMMPFEHSIVHRKFINKPDIFLRPPNHINPVKREIAVKFPFPSKSFGEDVNYSLAMVKAKALKTEVVVPEPLYFYTPGGEMHHGD